MSLILNLNINFKFNLINFKFEIKNMAQKYGVRKIKEKKKVKR